MKHYISLCTLFFAVFSPAHAQVKFSELPVTTSVADGTKFVVLQGSGSGANKTAPATQLISYLAGSFDALGAAAAAQAASAPANRTINGHSLSDNITLGVSDLEGLQDTLDGKLTPDGNGSDLSGVLHPSDIGTQVLAPNGDGSQLNHLNAGSFTSGMLPSYCLPQFSGDVSSYHGSVTLNTVNFSPGSYSNANITVNSKGLVTAVSNGSDASSLGSMASQNFDGVGITGGSIQGLSDLGVMMPENTAMSGFLLGTITDTTARPFTISQGWNNSDLVGKALEVNVTNSSSSAASLLADFRVNDSSVLAIRKDGVLDMMPSVAYGGLIGGTAGGVMFGRKDGPVTVAYIGNVGDTNGVTVGRDGTFGFSSNMSGFDIRYPDTWMTRGGAPGSLQFGGDSATPVSYTLKAGGGTGSNIAGADLTLQPGNGTGTGGSGSLLFQTSPASSSGSTANTPVTRLSIDKAGTIKLPGLTTNGVLTTSGGNGTVGVATDYLHGSTGVTAGSYTSASITVDAQGRVTSAASGGGAVIDPQVYYVRSGGNDGTATGTIIAPYGSAQAAYNAGVVAGVSFVLDLGVGSFTIGLNADWSPLCLAVRGAGYGTSASDSPTRLYVGGAPPDVTNSTGRNGYNISLSASELYLNAYSGGGGVIATDGGTYTGGNAGSLTIYSSGTLIAGGAPGGNGEPSNDSNINGGAGGAMTLIGLLRLASDLGISIIGGSGVGTGGIPGPDGSLTADGCDLRGTIFAGSGSVTFGRVSYLGGWVTVTNDRGGNAVW